MISHNYRFSSLFKYNGSFHYHKNIKKFGGLNKMAVNEKKIENVDQVFEMYEEIRESLAGLKEILKINFLEKDFYYQAGMDNLEALDRNVLEILKAASSDREVRIRLREMEELEKLRTA